MDNDYIIEQLRKRHGDDHILSLFQEDVKRLKNNALSNFPVSLLAHMLSFVTLKDVKAVSMVCKLWHRAFMLPTFWKRHIECKLELHKEENKWLRDFDNFRFSHKESLRQQTEWLFMWGPRSFRKSRLHKDFFERFSKIGKALFWTYDCYAYGSVEYHVPEGYWRTGIISTIEYFHGRGKYRIIRAEIPFTEEMRCYSARSVPCQCELYDGSTFEGKGINAKQIVPHGAGKWTFPNGDVFKGDNVAFDGEPHGTGTDQNGNKVEYFAGKKIK